MRFNFFILIIMLFSCPLSAAKDASTEKTQQETQSLEENDESEVNQDKGKTTYEQFCVVCHQDGVAGAPKYSNEKDWAPRLSGKTITDLVDSAVKGLNLMPALGTCNECSTEDLEAAIKYMLPRQ